MDFSQIIDFIIIQFPSAAGILSIIGTLVVILSLVDFMIDDEKDGGFFNEKVLKIPFLGPFLTQLKRFSLLRNSKDEPEEPKE